ncbi:aldehyde dehydrogenase (NAD+) [Lutimaribacter pacificus]|uniref:Aldehyde dehydrogenase (NAD+) n=1 Tax=Lutimaribacter pacificus TaxID=391948 RepID=A0A1H0GP21_9RHOB|nr:aldehyde dehydrogenase family protein [Lutimaribacter pacificus]SDO08653.1 aldehyde dehydrogenase (NAD+) [Lutimaribacter pacificus]SHJ90089.1 aldehyde dehydrogenase (NAD+) [Lutimaribacter pacificus]
MTVKEIFDSMDYGPAPESAAEALAWLVDQGDRFGHFIDGAFTDPGDGFDSRNPATGEVLATLTQASAADVDAAVAAARKAQPKWVRLGGHGRARHLYALARMIQKHARLFAVLETMDNGKPIRESRDIDVPLVHRHFYHHAGLAQLMDSELPGMAPHGVCGQVIPWNFPLLMLAWKVAPALAAGNTVVLKPAEYTSLTALLFADICRRAGLPRGVVNIVTGDGAVGEMIVAHDGIDKVAFTGSTEVGRAIRRATAGQGKPLTLELGGKSPYIVFDDADLDSAVEGLVDAIWFNGGQVCCAGSRLIVQEGVADEFHNRLRARMDKLRIGDPLDKSIDVGAIVDPVQRDRIARMVADCSTGTVHQLNAQLPAQGCFYPPTLITGLSPSDPLMQEEIFGPVLVSTSFRTPAEAVELANDTRYGLAASLWSENLNLALDVAPKLAAGVIWVNATNLFDAAAPFGGMRESGFGREGGWEGLRAYLRPDRKTKPLARIDPFAGNGADPEGIDRTAKLYIGGRQARPDGGYTRAVYGKNRAVLGEVPIANRKDIRNAVEAAAGAAGWAKTTGHARAQILYYIAENLSARAGEFAHRIDAMTGGRKGAEEVGASIRRLFTWAAWADKFDGRVKGVPLRGVAMAMRSPVGVIGALCPDEAPLLGLVSVMGPAVAMGNRCVLVASEPFPLAATDFYQVLDTSDMPGGVVNILTGSHAELAPTLAQHAGVDALWSFSSTDLSARIEADSAATLKRTWVNHTRARDWAGAEGEGHAFLEAATEVRTIWVPYGE